VRIAVSSVAQVIVAATESPWPFSPRA
jgi:hypothetical protein